MLNITVKAVFLGLVLIVTLGAASGCTPPREDIEREIGE
tara:strand:+ start:890 stop:1006 length:117 start_codon:yes stop_codon:yes gene_type:complete